MKKTTRTLLAALVFSVLSAEAQVYKWIDKDGNVQYSDRVKMLANDRYRLWNFNHKGDATWLSSNERQAGIESKKEFISQNCE